MNNTYTEICCLELGGLVIRVFLDQQAKYYTWSGHIYVVCCMFLLIIPSSSSFALYWYYRVPWLSCMPYNNYTMLSNCQGGAYHVSHNKVCESKGYTHGIWYYLDITLIFSQNADDMAGGASEVNTIPMAECMAYGALGTHQAENIPVSQCLAYS